jgi:hypothetical protein
MVTSTLLKLSQTKCSLDKTPIYVNSERASCWYWLSSASALRKSFLIDYDRLTIAYNVEPKISVSISFHPLMFAFKLLIDSFLCPARLLYAIFSIHTALHLPLPVSDSSHPLHVDPWVLQVSEYKSYLVSLFPPTTGFLSATKLRW